LGCDSQRLLKALIEVARRSDDESIQKALDGVLRSVMPYVEHQVRTNRETQFLANSLIEVLLRNLQGESSNIRRIAASSIATICSVSELQMRNTIIKLKNQIDSFKESKNFDETNKLTGLWLCAREIEDFKDRYHEDIVNLIIRYLLNDNTETSALVSAFETLRDIVSKFELSFDLLCTSAKSIATKFLVDGLSDKARELTMKQGAKVILQSNALACLTAIVRQHPDVLESMESLIALFKYHRDTAVRNQAILFIGTYIDSYWRFPACIQKSIDCEKIRKLWVELRSIINDDSAHPDTLKSCICSIRTCIGILLESDHCLHIVEYQDLNRLIHLYTRSNFKPLKIETLNLFASLNYRTLYYLERHHWSKLRCHSAGSLMDSLQDRILNEVIISSLIDENQRIRNAASDALISLIPNLYIASSGGVKTSISRPSDPIVSLASSLSCEHMVVLEHSNVNIGLLGDSNDSLVSSETHDRLVICDEQRLLSSSIIHFSCHSNQNTSYRGCYKSSQSRENISVNLARVVNLLKNSLEESLSKGKSSIVSIVKTLYELSLAYPNQEYSSSWDCRQSEYCDSFVLVNFLMSYMENLAEPDVIVEDLDAYRTFLALIHQLLYALCHESVRCDYEAQRMRPHHKRSMGSRDGSWSELTIKHAAINEILQTYFKHLMKLLWVMSYVIEEKTNPFAQASSASKQSYTSTNQSQKLQTSKSTSMEVLTPNSHDTLTSNYLLFGRIHKKLESSLKSSKKNLNQRDEKFYQLLDTCLSNMSSIVEFMSMSKTIEYVRDILSYLRVTYVVNSLASLICSRQLLKSLFGINMIALYQADPVDWFEEETSNSPQVSHNNSGNSSSLLPESNSPSLQGVYYHLVTNPYKVFSNYQSNNSSQITPASDRALATLNFEGRRALKVRRRIEDRVKSLFDASPHQIIPPKIRLVSDELKNIIAEFTPIVTECMTQFLSKGFCIYQAEVLHFMCYLLLLRVNFQKLPLAGEMIESINKLLDRCGDRTYLARDEGIELLVRTSFTFLTLLTYERGPSKPLFQVATIIQRFDDLRAKLKMASATERDVSTYIVPLLRCLVEDFFIYRTEYFQNEIPTKRYPLEARQTEDDSIRLVTIDKSPRDMFEHLEAERETVAQKLLDVVDNAGVYDLLSILILESRKNSSEIKYKKLSQQLLAIIPSLLSKRSVNLSDYKRLEITRRIIENISPEVFHPINFIIETLLEAPKPKNHIASSSVSKQRSEFQRWMSLVIISIHVLTTQVQEERFLSRIREFMSDQDFVEYLLQIAQLCTAEIIIQLWSPIARHQDLSETSKIDFSIQQLSCYLLYITHMFQSGLFYQLSKKAMELIESEVKSERELPTNFNDLCSWCRNPDNGFSLIASERMFYHLRLSHPDLTINWCNVMSLLNNVDCNRDFWRNLLVYDCHHCQSSPQDEISTCLDDLSINDSPEGAEILEDSHDTGKGFKRAAHINRPSSLNLSDIRFSDQLRRSFIKKIATTESRDKTLNRNIVETSDEDGHLLEREVSIGNTEQCLSPNIELTRRGVLCLVLDYVSISMTDVEHITWLIIHHINDIIRWSHETPIADFINAVHGNSASSGIFIQAINTNFNNLTSISFVTRLLWTLEKVHYTQYGSLVVLLVEKLLSSKELMPYRLLTRKIEEFACETVQKLLNDTNKSLITTNDEVINQLTTDDLDRVMSMLDSDLYVNLTKLLSQLRQSSQGQESTPTIELHRIMANDDSDDECKADLLFEGDEIEILYKMANLIYWLAEQGYSAQTSTLIPALNNVKSLLSKSSLLERINRDYHLVCSLVSSVYSLALNVLPPPTRLARPKLWEAPQDADESTTKVQPADNIGKSLTPDREVTEFTFDDQSKLQRSKPTLPKGSRRPAAKATSMTKRRPARADNSSKSRGELIRDVQRACLEGLFLFDNINYLQITQFECINEIIIRLARLPLVNSFILTPPVLWRQNLWPLSLDKQDEFKTNFPLVTHDILIRDINILDSFCDRILKLGWTNRRQFEEIWMTLMGVLSASLSQDYNSDSKAANNYLELSLDTNGGLAEKKAMLASSCRVIITLTKYLELTRRSISGDPLSEESYPVQSFDERVVGLTKTIATNLTALRKKTANMFDMIETSQFQINRRPESPSTPTTATTVSKDSMVTSDASNTPASSSNYQNYQIFFNRQGTQTMPNYSHFLKIPAHKLRLNSILNVELDMQDIVVIAEGDQQQRVGQTSTSTSPSSLQSSSNNDQHRRPDEIDVESCVRLILTIFKQKLKDPTQLLYTAPQSLSPISDSEHIDVGLPADEGKLSSAVSIFTDSIQNKRPKEKSARQSGKNHANQLPPPLSTAIVQSILALSDMFTDYDQFIWLFDTFWNLFKVAERNEDEIQMQFLVLGLCKVAAVCCYEIPNEFTTGLGATLSALPHTGKQSSGSSSATGSSASSSAAAIHQRELIFERCRQVVERCVKSDFLPLKISTLYGVFYILEDSINIVASGAWELDDFKRLRQMRLAWIVRLMPIMLDKESGKLLGCKGRTFKLLELLCETVAESELKAMKNS